MPLLLLADIFLFISEAILQLPAVHKERPPRSGYQREKINRKWIHLLKCYIFIISEPFGTDYWLTNITIIKELDSKLGLIWCIQQGMGSKYLKVKWSRCISLASVKYICVDARINCSIIPLCSKFKSFGLHYRILLWTSNNSVALLAIYIILWCISISMQIMKLLFSGHLWLFCVRFQFHMQADHLQ